MNKDIQVNALMSQDNIKIIVTANVKNNIISIHEEVISSGKDLSKKDIKISIKNVINRVEEKISRKIKSLNIIFDDFMKSSEHLKISTRILEDKLEFSNNKFLNADDCNKIVEQMIDKSKKSEKDKILISAVPFKFVYVEDIDNFEKESFSFPIDRRIKKLKVLFSVRYMDKKNYLKVLDYFSLLDLKEENVALESQLAIYGVNTDLDNNLGKTNFALIIQNSKTILVSSVNNIVIKTDVLDYSFYNLVKKIALNFGISTYEAKKIIDCYGKLNIGELYDNEVVYSSHSFNGEISKPVKKSDIADVIKSFLKSICIQANNLIKQKISNLSANSNFELKIVGPLSKISNITTYCSKYFEKINIILDNENEFIYEWNKSFLSVKNYWAYMKTLDNLKPKSFYYNNNNYNKNYRKELFVEEVTERNNRILLA